MVLQGSTLPLGNVLVCRGCGARHTISTDNDSPFHNQAPVCCRSCGAEFFPPPNIPEIEVDDRLRRKTRPHRRYLGRPEVKAGDYIHDHRHTESRLVRGTLAGGHPYAWVEIAGVLFDPGYQRFYDPASWYAATGAQKHNEEMWPVPPPPPPPGDESYPADWLTADEVADRLGLTTDVVEQAISAGWLRAHSVPKRKGGGWRISPYFFGKFVGFISDLAQAVAEREGRSTSTDKHEHS